MSILDIAGNVSIVLGAVIFATAALGIVRFPDAYTRISAVGTAGGLGIVFVVTGAVLLQPSLTDAAKVVLIVILQLATSAVGSIAIARSAYLTRTQLARPVYNDLDPDDLDNHDLHTHDLHTHDLHTHDLHTHDLDTHDLDTHEHDPGERDPGR